MPQRKKNNGRRGTIDVLIPAIEKDLGTLPYVIDGVRKHVQHNIRRIYVVSPNSSKMKALCKRKGCTFIHETKALPITKKDIQYGSKRWERSGWLYQQLLKLNGDRVVSQRYFLVIDADTVLIRPHRFRTGGQTVFYYRGWTQPEYRRTYRRLMGRKMSSRRSFVAHYMLFDKVKLARMKRRIASRHHTAWYSAIMRSIDKSKQFGFSEYETYGNYIHSRRPQGIRFKYCANKSLRMSAARLSTARKVKLARTYRSLSFHKRSIYSRRTK
ncbi:DUF6492 family protein [Paenibacillus sp. y28]|uniref:DUF6492 family protein n=1 Tax=Paenibacillus sp. y28 TaxID=3129110 RepID=UPI0030198C26